jgi:hypothetical protein
VLTTGFTWFVGPGYRLGVPEDFRSSPEGDDGDVAFYERDTSRSAEPRLRLEIEQKPGDVLAATIAGENQIRLPAYRRLRIEQVTGSPDVVWEFTYRDPARGPMHALRRMVPVDGLMYVFDWRTTLVEWSFRQTQLDQVLNAFRPVG